MATKIDQKAYLQKYLGGKSGDKKKKKKKVVKGAGFKIIDDDLDLTKLRALEGDELDVFDQGEDAPQIAGIIDDRPEELKKLDQLTSKWKDDGFNSKLQIEEIKKDVKETEKENELIFGKMYSDSEDEKNDSDASPPRQKDKKGNRKGSDSDASPPRRRQNDSDNSPPRKVKKDRDSDVSPPRKRKDDESPKRKKNSSRKDADSRRKDDSDESPPRKKGKETKDKSKRKRKDSDSDVSPPRRHRKDSDESPPRKNNRNDSSRRHQNGDRSESKRQDNDSNQSPPRKNIRQVKDRRKPSRWGDVNDRITAGTRSSSNSPRKSRKTNYDSDLSPPRRSRKSPNAMDSGKRDKYENKGQSSDSDLSPPRKKRDKNRDNDSPPPTNKKMAKTLEGKLAGLQNAVQLRDENAQFRRREEEAFKRMTDDVSGRNAQAVSRKAKRETSEDRQKLKDKAERQKMLDEKYKKWSKGIKQVEAQETRIQDYLHESSKPLARHANDRDLEQRLKHVERDGDPMLRYMRDRQREKGDMGPEKPMYKGNFPPNRFNIRPGYRWDGVDRSNGYESKYFESQSKKRAQEEEAYKWSTEDL